MVVQFVHLGLIQHTILNKSAREEVLKQYLNSGNSKCIMLIQMSTAD